jgi:hypothetical protein
VPWKLESIHLAIQFSIQVKTRPENHGLLLWLRPCSSGYEKNPELLYFLAQIEWFQVWVNPHIDLIRWIRVQTSFRSVGEEERPECTRIYIGSGLTEHCFEPIFSHVEYFLTGKTVFQVWIGPNRWDLTPAGCGCECAASDVLHWPSCDEMHIGERNPWEWVSAWSNEVFSRLHAHNC